MSYYERNKERVKQYNLNKYHQMSEDKKEKLLKERNDYFKIYYEETKVLKKRKYNKKEPALDRKQYNKKYEIHARTAQKSPLLKNKIEIYKPELATNTELDLYDIF